MNTERRILQEEEVVEVDLSWQEPITIDNGANVGVKMEYYTTHELDANGDDVVVLEAKLNQYGYFEADRHSGRDEVRVCLEFAEVG